MSNEVVRIYVEQDGLWFTCWAFQHLRLGMVWRCGKCRRGIVAGYKKSGKPYAKNRCGVCHCKVHAQVLKPGAGRGEVGRKQK